MSFEKPIESMLAYGRLHLRAIKSLAVLAVGIGGFTLSPTNASALSLPVTLHTVKLAWDAVPETNIQGYRIHVGTQSQQYTASYNTGAAIAYSVSDLEYGRNYYFAVSAIGSTGLESSLSTELVVNVAQPIQPPTLHTMKLAWDAVPETDIQGYRVHVGTQSQQYTASYNTGVVNAYPINDLEYGKTYYFAVSTIGSSGLESSLSGELAVNIAPPPLPTAGLSVSNGSGQAGLQWTFPKSALGSSPEFVVSASPDMVTWTEVDTILPAQASGGDALNLEFSWPLQVVGSQRFFRLTARNWMGNSTAP